MAFRELPDQGSINPCADAYVETALRLSRFAEMTTRNKLDIPYGNEHHQRLDIYLPEDESLDALPVYINVHGGGWLRGYKEWMALNAPAIVEFPAVYVSVGYCLSPPDRRLRMEALRDCLRATAWLRDHIGSYGGDPGRMYMGGHCTGGHLASLLVLRRDLLDDFDLPHDIIKACFPYSGVYDVRDSLSYGVVDDGRIGAAVQESPEQAHGASPIAHVAGNQIPFFVTWGENDSAICKAQGPAFTIAARLAGTHVETHTFPSFDHFWTHIDQQRPQNPWTVKLRNWMMNGPPGRSSANTR
jgi:arylformamidase